MNKRILAGAACLVCAAAMAVCGAQAPPVTGVCVANCGSGGGNTNTTTHSEARAYSSYVKAYNQALKQYQQAIRLGATAQGLSLCQSAQSSIDTALQYAPGDGDALLLRRRIVACIDSCNGTFAVRNGDIDRGISFYREAESADPDDRGLWEQSIAWAESMRQQAIANANAKAAADRERAEADRAREKKAQTIANAKEKIEAQARAEADFREKMAQRDVLWERGKQLQENNDYKAAEAVWRQMIALLPEDPTGYNGLGYALSSQGRNAEAEAAYRKSIQADPNYVAPLTNLAMLLAEKEMRVTEAEALYRQALKLDPSNISAKLGLGEIYLYQNRYAEAEDMYRKALEVTPEDARLKEALRSMIELHALHDRSNQSKQTTTPLITAGENLKDAVNSGGSSGTEDASNASQSQKALDEASSSLGATGQGLQSTTPEGKTTGRREDAVAGGSKIFDTKGEKIAAPPVDLRGMGKAPTDVKLLSHIPKNAITDNDKEIKASVDWYSKLESDKADTQQKIANIQKQIENKQGDQGILKMEQTQYTNDLQNIQQNQQRAEDAIKKRLVKLDMPWIETPAPPKTETKPDTATQEKQP